MIFEKSAMAIVLCNDFVLATHEMIYGKLTISVPKGHIESGEDEIEAAIRETKEETGVKISKENFVKKLEPFEIKFVNHYNQEVIKTIYPVVFVVDKIMETKITEERVLKVEFMEIAEFIKLCRYDNVKEIVRSAKNDL